MSYGRCLNPDAIRRNEEIRDRVRLARGRPTVPLSLPKLPGIEEFARFLFERGNPDEARPAIRRLLQTYAGTFAAVEGMPNAEAQRQAEQLFETVFLSADELEAEYGR